MYYHSNTSKRHLAQAHSDFGVLFAWVIKFYDHTVAASYRTKELQNQYFQEGKSTRQYPSIHNTKPSLAVDVYVYEKTHVDYDELQAYDFAGFVKGVAAMLYNMGLIAHKIKCGNDWDSDQDVNDTNFKDPGHFEIIPNPGETIEYFEI